MIKGGYQIIDLKGIELDDTPLTYDGIYDKMLENVGKVCLVANVDVNDPNFDHFFVQPIMSGTTILCTVGSKTLKVNAEDGVSVEDGIVGGGSGGSSDYTDLSNKPSINSVTLAGNKTSHDLGLQGELTAGTGINIENDVISATGSSSGPKITISGTINSTSNYSGFNDVKLQFGGILAANHNVVMNCPVDLKPLITTSSFSENMLAVPVEGIMYPGKTSNNSCYIKGMAYIWETNTRYNIYIRCTSARGSYIVQSIYCDHSINKSSMSDPTKLILSDTKLQTINYFTSSYNLDLGIDLYTARPPFAIINGSGSGSMDSNDVHQLHSTISSAEKFFLMGISIDGQTLTGAVSAVGHYSETWDGERGEFVYSITIYFLKYKLVIEWDDLDNEYKYTIT